MKQLWTKLVRAIFGSTFSFQSFPPVAGHWENTPEEMQAFDQQLTLKEKTHDDSRAS